MCSVTNAKGLATSPKTVPTNSLHQEHLITTAGHIHGYTMTTTIEADHSPLTTDTAMVDASTGHNHTTISTITEALATTKDTHLLPIQKLQQFTLSFDQLTP